MPGCYVGFDWRNFLESKPDWLEDFQIRHQYIDFAHDCHRPYANVLNMYISRAAERGRNPGKLPSKFQRWRRRMGRVMASLILIIQALNWMGFGLLISLVMQI